MKQKNHAEAVAYFNKSLAEQRTKDVLDLLKQSEKAVIEAERQAYVNPEIAAQEKAKGNQLFKEG